MLLIITGDLELIIAKYIWQFCALLLLKKRWQFGNKNLLNNRLVIWLCCIARSVPANIGALVYSKLRQDPLCIFEYTALSKNRIFEYTGFCGHFVMSILVLVVQVTRRRRTCTIGPSSFFVLQISARKLLYSKKYFTIISNMAIV
jgi:hypothetical protein